MRWAQTHANGHRRVGPGANFRRRRVGSGVGCRRGCVRTQGPGTDESRIAHSHCGGDTCLGADGCDIGRKPERARAGAGWAYAAAEGAHAATGAGGINKFSSILVIC
jgi:hypothetical protein